MNEIKRGILYVFSGPSGVGKGTVKEKLFQEFSPKVVYSVSATTRKPRVSEVDGIDYEFISRKEFEQRIQSNDFLEYAEYSGNYYGTPKKNVEQLLDDGHDVLLEIEVQGALQIMNKMKGCITIFILPPSFEILEQRLRGRGTEEEAVIQQRLLKAKEEIQYADLYQYRIINYDIEESYKELRTIYLRHSSQQ